jgi:hypothetical protein
VSALANAALARFVRVEETPNGARWLVGAGDKRAGLRGRAIAIVSLKHAGGYEVVLQLDNGKLDSFAPYQLLPEGGS